MRSTLRLDNERLVVTDLKATAYDYCERASTLAKLARRGELWRLLAAEQPQA